MVQSPRFGLVLRLETLCLEFGQVLGVILPGPKNKLCQPPGGTAPARHDAPAHTHHALVLDFAHST